jgi:three-Cys-motif partner protein
MFYVCSIFGDFQMAKQSAFAGAHTVKKLDAIASYLQAYQTALKNQNFETIFFDAFAGTGELPTGAEDHLLPEFADKSEIIEGSARRALRVVPSFDRYVFVEQMKGKADELLEVKSAYSALGARISVVSADANDAVTDFCASTNWDRSRAVMFLDPFGNQVSFATIEAIANCKIDLWYLFPAGIGVNRQITNDGSVVASAERSLDRLYGTPEWRRELIRQTTIQTLFGEIEIPEKISSADVATRFMIRRMKTVFHDQVLDSWLPLGRSGGHWYSLIFSCGNPNPRAWSLASRIAKAVMTRK